MEQVYIETQDLSVGYHGKALLKDIALKVKKGRNSCTDWPEWRRKIYHFKKLLSGKCSPYRGIILKIRM